MHHGIRKPVAPIVSHTGSLVCSQAWVWSFHAFPLCLNGIKPLNIIITYHLKHKGNIAL